MHGKPERRLLTDIRNRIGVFHQHGKENLQWLEEQMHPYFFITMKEEIDALTTLAMQLDTLAANHRLILADREKALILACRNVPGSLYGTLRTLHDREITYTEIIHSLGPIPGLEHSLEIQRYEFDRKDHRTIAGTAGVSVPRGIGVKILDALREHYPAFDFDRFDRYLKIIWLNNRNYVRISPPRRVAQLLWLFYQGNAKGGVFLDVEETKEPDETEGYRVLFAAGNPPQKGFLLQIMEAFNRLGIGIQRTYCLNISNGVHPYFLGTFYARARETRAVTKGTELFERLRNELYNTQILSTNSYTYQHFMARDIMSGEDASLINAFIAFCHTNLAHNRQESYHLNDVKLAFHSNPNISLQLVDLFRTRFSPGISGRKTQYENVLRRTEESVEGHNTGHRYLDEFRRSIFKCCIDFIRHTLKTNFFVLGKQALAFRLDPKYLSSLDPVFTADLPPKTPFRITFFFGRFGIGYHIGFSDIARGGWRTIITGNRDDYDTNADTLFREVFVLAHTQHLKNKDIYEGGSKMVVVLDASGLEEADFVTQRMYKLQYGFINAFLDIFITEDGKVSNPRVVDYYGEDEPIELGPDENMHDSMIETIARLSVRRGYMLGDGIISSKKNGINHKEYGVTSTGVVKFAEITMEDLGIDMGKDAFSVKFTGGPDGDVAGNAIRILFEKCPRVKINLILDGTGALFDPDGGSRSELKRILFKGDIDAFRPSKLHKGGFLIFRSNPRVEGLKTLYRKVSRSQTGELVEQWLSTDDFHREYDNLIFEVHADLFIPAGGRPETVHDGNWQKFFPEGSEPTLRAIVEGANSFITPDARVQLQKRGFVIMRDASANKCGVISSSYEVIANLIMGEKEFLANKERYVSDVIEILEKRAADEAYLILARFRESNGKHLFTEISDAISVEINDHYARLFGYLQDHPQLAATRLFRMALFSHLPRFLRENRKYHARINKLPGKYRSAILASEIASSLTYRSNRDSDFEEMIKGHLKRVFDGRTRP